MPTPSSRATPLPLEYALHAFRSAMPEAAGVILSTRDGRVLAHEELVADDPRALAAQAAQQHARTTWSGQAGASALVEGNAGAYLVVFLRDG